MSQKELPKCETCNGKKVNSRGQRCLDCNGIGIEEAELIEYEPSENEDGEQEEER